MQILSRLRLRTKLVLLTGLCALAFVGLLGVASSMLREHMLEDRIDKLRAVVLEARSYAQLLEQTVASGQITRQQALAMFRDHVHAMRYGGPDDYLLVQTYDGTVVMHGGDPKREGKLTTAVDSQGRNSAELARIALGNTDGGVITYDVAKPGQTVRLPKLSYVGRFPPWQVDLITGSWTDDIDASFTASLWRLALLGAAILVLTLSVSWLIARDITRSLGALKTAMVRLAEGDLAVTVPETGRRDEVGGMAEAVVVFKDAMQCNKQLTVEQAREQEVAEATKRAALTNMARTIEAQAAAALDEVGHLTLGMTEATVDMTASAQRTGASIASASSAADQALSNARTVEGAAGRLSGSIRAIAGQVEHSTAVVARAVEAGRSTREKIAILHDQVARIGAVADMIGEIAAKTNLLALNATIEAARAGEAGKGFAVVASEVKQLANQTARSTEEIARHLGEVRAATGESVAAVEQIESTITEINAIAGSIAEAVEQQGAATAEIACSVTDTASAAHAMTDRISEVSTEANETGRRATKLRDDTHALRTAVQRLQQDVVEAVRASVHA
jgi:methyl-accepting chemotaxis protein